MNTPLERALQKLDAEIGDGYATSRLTHLEIAAAKRVGKSEAEIKLRLAEIDEELTKEPSEPAKWEPTQELPQSVADQRAWELEEERARLEKKAKVFDEPDETDEAEIAVIRSALRQKYALQFRPREEFEPQFSIYAIIVKAKHYGRACQMIDALILEYKQADLKVAQSLDPRRVRDRAMLERYGKKREPDAHDILTRGLNGRGLR